MRTAIVLFLLSGFMIAPVYSAEAKTNRALAEDDDSFSRSAAIPDHELDKERGGFMNINGMLVNFAFTGIASINGNIVSQIQVDMAGVISAANGNPSNFLQPTVIQNVDNNALIQVQQTLNLQVSNAQQVMGSSNQFNQYGFQSVFAF